MFASPAFAQTAAHAASGGGPQDLLVQFAPLVIIAVLGYFMLLRPQQQRAKQHREMIGAMKRGDTVVLSSGVIGKVAKVEDTELQIEIATGVVIKVVRSMVSEVRARAEPVAANAGKP